MNNDFIIGLSYADRIRLATESRHQALSETLSSELCSLTSLMGPMSDGPEWPAGAAWLSAHHAGNACVISDGLSDPWVERDKPETGLGLEVFIESPDSGIPANAALTEIANTWLFPLIAEISHTLAGYPKLCDKLLSGKLSSMEFNIDHIKDGRGRVGALLNISNPLTSRFAELNGNRVKLVSATILTGQELRFLRGKGEAGLIELAEKLQSSGKGHLSLLYRKSLT